jgi:prepilin signal peptidase PulO-like enzyme (type II secretory pathway)
MSNPGAAAGVAAVVVVVAYVLAALVAETPRPGSPLPAPPLPGALRRWVASTPQVVVGVLVVAILVGVVLVWAPVFLPVVLLLCLGVPAAYTDARELRLPDELTYALAATTIVAVVALQATGVGDGAVRAVFSGAEYALALLLFAVFAPTGKTLPAESGSVRTATPTALGLGDIKLAVGLGVVLGWSSVAAVTGAVFLTAAGHLLWLIGVTLARRAGHSRGMTATALGPWMVLGAVVVLGLSHPLS